MTSLNSEYKKECLAPFLKESTMQLEMQFVVEYPIKENDTIFNYQPN